MLPQVFAKGGKSNTEIEVTFPLPGVTKYNHWNDAGLQQGVKYLIQRGVNEASALYEPIHYEWATTRSSEVSSLAAAYLSHSVNFINKLSETFIENTYASVRNKVEADEAWRMVASGVRAMFMWLREVRITAQSANQLHMDKVAVTAEVLWASGQCHMRMKDIMNSNFRNHQVVATALNHHLFEHRVPMSDYERLEKRVTALERENRTQQRTIDSHTSSIANLQGRARGGGGAGNGGRGAGNGGGGGRGNGGGAQRD